MLRHVLVPLDGSELAEKALDFARRVLAPDGKITLLTALQDAEPPLYVYPDADVVNELAHDDTAMQAGEARAQGYLEHQASNLKLNGLQADVVVGVGDPAALIVDRALRLGVEAIVLCTHGRSGLQRLLFGSVTLKVLNEAPCPVIVVPNREQVRVSEEAPATDTAADLGLDTLAAE